MHRSLLSLLFATLTFGAVADVAAKSAPKPPHREDYTFRAANGTEVKAERVTFTVPEHRDNPRSRSIELSFVRFPSTNPKPGSPIVYLAGGPGGSGVGTARGERFPLFMALREVADVIAFDQRGTGDSNHIPRCDAGTSYPLDQPLRAEAVQKLLLDQAKFCAKFWREAGVDLAGYTTWESAADLDELRRVLGAKKITLWGISYGTHLGLATIKRYPKIIDKAVFASIEDLHETVKLPALTEAYFTRLQAAIKAEPGAAQLFPDVRQSLQALLEALDKQPITVDIVQADGKPARLTLGKIDLQMLLSGMIADPSMAANIPAMVLALTMGENSAIAQPAYDYLRKDFGRYASGMAEAMDVASGISPARLSEMETQARTAVLGDWLNFPMPQLRGAYGMKDLGESFRAPFSADTPILFLSGTLDGRTYPESAAQTAARFPNAKHVLVENAGHNLFMLSPEITQTIVAFLEGRKLEHDRLVVPAPSFLAALKGPPR